MTRHPTHSIGIVIMHLAAQNPFSPWAIFRGGDRLLHRLKAASSQFGEIDESSGAQSQRLENPILAEAVEIESGQSLHNFTQNHKAKIAVESLCARGSQRLFAVDLFQHITLCSSTRNEIDPARFFHFHHPLIIRFPGRQPGGVIQELTNG